MAPTTALTFLRNFYVLEAVFIQPCINYQSVIASLRIKLPNHVVIRSSGV